MSCPAIWSAQVPIEVEFLLKLNQLCAGVRCTSPLRWRWWATSRALLPAATTLCSTWSWGEKGKHYEEKEQVRQMERQMEKWRRKTLKRNMVVSKKSLENGDSKSEKNVQKRRKQYKWKQCRWNPGIIKKVKDYKYWKSQRGRENKTQSSCMLVETESIQVLNKADGGPGMPAELSLDISCQHFITVAVIKRRRPRRWPRAAKLHLDWIDKPPTATAAVAQWLQQELRLICTHFNQLAKKSQTSHHIYVMVFSDRCHTSGKLPDALF